MNIGTLTLHAGFNEGAILQSLALQTALSEVVPSSKVEIIDHRYPQLMDKVYGPVDNDRKEAMRHFYDEQLPLSPERFYSSSHAKTFEFLNSNYNAVVVGSDEVWKISFQRRLGGLLRLQTDPYSPAYPNAFWPDVAVKSSKIAYAATVGEKTSWSSFSPRLQRSIATRLNAFQAIGVRDERTAAFVLWADSSLEDRVVWTPDPTFITNLTQYVPPAQVRDLLVKLGVDFSRPRALVIAKDHALYAEAILALGRQGVQTVSVSDSNSHVELDLTKAAIGPGEWAGLARHFDVCLSERMHGCIFTILNGTPLICLDSRHPTQGFPTKNNVVMTKFGLEDQYVSVHSANARDKLLALCELGSIANDNGAIAAKTKEFRDIGRDFLAQAFSEIAR